MAALPNLITVEEFRLLPDSGEYCYELHGGEVVAMTRPKSGHVKLQRRLEHLLQSKLASFGEVCMEWPYRAVGEFDLRVADVAVISRVRWDSLDADDDLRGSPELAVEVISPSNSRTKMRQTVSLCLANGALECWLVDPKKQSVTVVCQEGTTSVYAGQDEIPLAAFGGDALSVRDIFAE